MLTADIGARFANLALGHVTREYPYAPGHVLGGPEDLLAPRALHPIFYGSFDWHSCVHSYWLLATLYRVQPGLQERERIRALFDDALTQEKIATERAYLKRPLSGGFERPYGWAWLLILAAELHRHGSPEAQLWKSNLQPLADDFVARFRAYLPKLSYPIRAGTHSNTAFALTLAAEYAGVAGDKDFAALISEKARTSFAADADCQAWEPSGEDFLSSALCEAECMRRVLPGDEFRVWFGRFLPHLAQGEPKTLFEPAAVADRHDGRIVHLDGLNLSRAWCWRLLASALDPADPIRPQAFAAASRHLDASLSAIAGDYMGEHWLATYALLALLAG